MTQAFYPWIRNCLPSRGRRHVSVSSAMFLPAQLVRRRVLIVSTTSRPCCSAVRITQARTAQAWAPDSLRLPPVIFRITTAGRNARSAALFVRVRDTFGGFFWWYGCSGVGHGWSARDGLVVVHGGSQSCRHAAIVVPQERARSFGAGCDALARSVPS